MKTKRQYLGFVVVDKLYAGEKTINWVVDDEQGRKLARLISDAAERREKFDLKIVKKPRGDGKYTLTITYI
jgi:hypothetical protein